MQNTSAVSPLSPLAPYKQPLIPQLIDLFGSMRFAISSLSILAVASIIGTLLKQREPLINYVNQFGPFWAELFRAASIYEIYNAWWFLVVLAFLITSTSLCVIRNSPKMLREMRSWRDKVRSSSLRSFHHHGEVISRDDVVATTARQSKVLVGLGYRVKPDVREDGTLLAAKRGSTNRLGYIFTHVGIVVIAVGGLLDSELPLKIMIKWYDRKPLPTEFVSGEAPANTRLPASNPSYRANVFVPEGGNSGLALLNTAQGTMVQDLPFVIELKKFNVEYYSTGMPKLFASDVWVIDKATGKREEATIKVNEPLITHGVAIYQSSFDDGGSKLTLLAKPLDGGGKTFTVNTEVGGSQSFARTGGEQLRLEITAFRPINVENTSKIDAPSADERKFKESVAAVLSPSALGRSKGLRNVGPSVQYKLRDSAGQAREYHVYQLPVEIDGQSMFLAGVRDNPNESFKFLRIPADAKGDMDEFIQLRAALSDPAMINQAAQLFAKNAAPKGADQAASPDMESQLAQSASRALTTFAVGGLTSVAEFIDKNVPKAEQERASEVILRVLGSSLWELWQVSRLRQGLPLAANDEVNNRFIQNAQNALSDSYLFGAPFLLQLSDFKEIKASVFQVTRSPGKNIVLLGSILLTLGIFAMFYIRERRIWCWISAKDGGTSHSLYAMSATRRTLLLDEDFAKLQQTLEHYEHKHAAPQT